MSRLRRSQAGPTYEAACAARPLFGIRPRRSQLPLWLWQLFVGSYVVFRPGFWSRDRGVAFGRVLANRIFRVTSDGRLLDPADEVPAFDAEVWFPSDPLGAGYYPGDASMLADGLSNGAVLTYVSEPEARTLRAFLPAWFAGAEPQPLSPELLGSFFGWPIGRAA